MQPSLNSKSYNQLLRFSATVIEGANNNNQHLYKNISATSSVRNFKLSKLLNEAVARRCSVTKVFLEILQNSQENKQLSGTGVFLVFSCAF